MARKWPNAPNPHENREQQRSCPLCSVRGVRRSGREDGVSWKGVIADVMRAHSAGVAKLSPVAPEGTDACLWVQRVWHGLLYMYTLLPGCGTDFTQVNFKLL